MGSLPLFRLRKFFFVFGLEFLTFVCFEIFLFGHHILAFKCIVGKTCLEVCIFGQEGLLLLYFSSNGLAFASGDRLASVVHVDSCFSLSVLEQFVQNCYHCSYLGWSFLFFLQRFKRQCKFLGAPLE